MTVPTHAGGNAPVESRGTRFTAAIAGPGTRYALSTRAEGPLPSPLRLSAIEATSAPIEAADAARGTTHHKEERLPIALQYRAADAAVTRATAPNATEAQPMPRIRESVFRTNIPFVEHESRWSLHLTPYR